MRHGRSRRRPVVILAVATVVCGIGVLTGLHLAGAFLSADERAEQRFSRGICGFLAAQSELALHPMGSVLVFRSKGNPCVDPSYDSTERPWYVGSSEYRWSGTTAGQRALAAYFAPALRRRRWKIVRISAPGKSFLLNASRSLQ